MTDLRQAAQQALKALESGLAFPTHSDILQNLRTALAMHQVSEFAQAQEQAEPVAMRLPKVGDKVICLEDESLGEVVSLTAGGSPDIVFDDGSRGTYMLREFAKLFGYVAPPQRQWVGLTNEDCTRMSAGDKLVAMWAEAKLKEKNSDSGY